MFDWIFIDHDFELRWCYFEGKSVGDRWTDRRG